MLYYCNVTSWGRRASHNRAQIVYYIAENLELRLAEVARRIQEMTGCEQAAACEEVELSIQRLFHWGAYADKYGGTVQVSLLHVCWLKGARGFLKPYIRHFLYILS